MLSIEELYDQAYNLLCNGEVDDDNPYETARRSGPHG